MHLSSFIWRTVLKGPLTCQLCADGWGLGSEQRQRAYTLVASAGLCHVVLSTKKNIQQGELMPSGEGRSPWEVAGGPLSEASCVCTLAAPPQQKRNHGKCHHHGRRRAQAQATPVSSQVPVPVFRARKREQGRNCLLRVWPSESYSSLQKSVSSSGQRVDY